MVSSGLGPRMDAFSAAAFCKYAQNVARPCSRGDQVVTERQTHTHTHGKTTITMCSG